MTPLPQFGFKFGSAVLIKPCTNWASIFILFASSCPFYVIWSVVSVVVVDAI